MTLHEPSNEDNEVVLPSELRNKKLVCRLWSDTGENSMPSVLARRKVRYGQPTFNAKIGGKDRFYKINYKKAGAIKQEGKQLYYDTHFLNTVGALSFNEHDEDVDSEEAYTVFKNNAVNMYVKKGGIPPMLLYIAFAMVMVLVVVIAYIAPSFVSATQSMEELDKQVTALKQQNAILQQQNTVTGGFIG